MNLVRSLCACLVLAMLASCATTAQTSVPTVLDTSCNWVGVALVRPTRAEVGTASAPGTMPKQTLQTISAGNAAIKSNCPEVYAKWKASLPAWE